MAAIVGIAASHFFNPQVDTVKEAAKKKTEAGKKAQKEKFQKTFAPVARTPLLQLKYIFDFMNVVVEAKKMIIEKMNKAGHISTFLKTTNGFKITGVEGFVAIDHLTGGAVKIVDRMEFSYANFSPEILKGWQR